MVCISVAFKLQIENVEKKWVLWVQVSVFFDTLLFFETHKKCQVQNDTVTVMMVFSKVSTEL